MVHADNIVVELLEPLHELTAAWVSNLDFPQVDIEFVLTEVIKSVRNKHYPNVSVIYAVAHYIIEQDDNNPGRFDNYDVLEDALEGIVCLLRKLQKEVRDYLVAVGGCYVGDELPYEFGALINERTFYITKVQGQPHPSVGELCRG